MYIGQSFWKARIGERAVLNPVDRTSEILFGLIIMLTFTGAISVANARHQEIRSLLWAAIGSNLAWGLVDAIMYMMCVLIERGHVVEIIKRVAQTEHPPESRRIVKSEFTLANFMTDEELDKTVERMKSLPPPPKTQLISWKDVSAAIQIFSMVFVCTLPVVLPFVLMDEVGTAIRVSNGIALLFLMFGGYTLAGYAGFRRIPTALAYTAIGLLLIAATVSLGG
jgi:hypothetical protein